MKNGVVLNPPICWLNGSCRGSEEQFLGAKC
jgi:hypothetical protein